MTLFTYNKAKTFLLDNNWKLRYDSQQKGLWMADYNYFHTYRKLYRTSQVTDELLQTDPKGVLLKIGFPNNSWNFTAFMWPPGVPQATTQEIQDAIAILKNNHWTQDYTRSVWENSSKTQFINDSHLQNDPKGAISNAGMDWDSEMRSLNTTWVSGTINKQKGSLSNASIAQAPSLIRPRMGYSSLNAGDWESDDSYKPDWTHKPECSHDWVKYTGLNEIFYYCKKCDVKK